MALAVNGRCEWLDAKYPKKRWAVGRFVEVTIRPEADLRTLSTLFFEGDPGVLDAQPPVVVVGKSTIRPGGKT